MDRPTRNAIERATQRARALLEEDFGSQLEGRYDMLPSGSITLRPPVDLPVDEVATHAVISAAIERKVTSGMDRADAMRDYLRDAAFTTLNRFVALKMLEPRSLVQQCVSRGEQSSGYAEFTGMAPGLTLLPDGRGYRLYLESLFDELSTEVKVLFDRRDPASVLWPRRAALEQLLQVLNAADLDHVWGEDETIGWVYQYFNGADERRKMREESQAPRNSRELAVRNQFFTPRYVVEFLTDNTLGRIWLEMYGETTRLAEACKYLVRSADEPVGSRPPKDPRDLRIFDPACGSGHFLLYAFDLLLTIYEEGWAAEGAGALRSELTGHTLRQEYPDLVALRRAAPGLIVEHNLHGVDIDARCAQIAALALWLRVQRAYQEQGIPASARPRIRRTHIVVAEPMPGNMDLARAFAAELDKPFQRILFGRMLEEMRLAGELGTLLPVERSLANDISRARQQFLTQEQTALPGFEMASQQGKLDLSGVTDESVFHDAEESILAALRAFAQSADGTDTRRRLFAGDAAQGVALIDLLRTRFDVVLMNPPFGAASLAAKKEFEQAYPRTKNDIYTAFVERGIRLLHPYGLLGAITSRTGFFLSSFHRWREEVLLNEARPVAFADLGYGVMDAAMVEAAAYCLERAEPEAGMKAVFLRVIEEDDKRKALLAATRLPPVVNRVARYEVEATRFTAIPRSPFAYWVSNAIRILFEQLPAVESSGRTLSFGPSTKDDFRYIRASVEVVPSAISCSRSGTESRRWVRLAKGGAFAPYYADVYLVLDWANDGATLKADIAEYRGGRGWGYHWSAALNGHEHYFRPGLTWPRRTNGLSFRALPAGCIFADKGPAAFVAEDRAESLLALAGVMNSQSFGFLVSVLLARTELAQSYEVGIIQRTPIPRLTSKAEGILASLASRAWSLRRLLDTRREMSYAFVLPAILQAKEETFIARGRAWTNHVREVESELAAIQREVDECCFELYGIDAEDRGAIMASSSRGTASLESSDSEVDEDTEDETDAESVVATLLPELLSWAVGVAFGRFDVRLATGARPLPPEPEPFDPLPVCSPGMLTGDDGLPLVHPPAGYPLSLPADGIFVDDPGNRSDLTAAVRAVFEVAFGSHADAFWQEAAALLDPRDHDLRHWLASGFFDHHLRRYSRSRRKAPILWQLAIPSGRYSVWCYAHRLTRDSLFAIQNDVVAPKLAHEERRLSSLRTQVGRTPAARERTEVADQETLVEELRTLLDEIRRVTPLWNANLDDGIVLVMAPLWRLVPTHRAWQRELQSKWDELAAGKYDWAHIAMHLWPERAVPKCATDRSLAIAHGLEDVFWVEGDDGKWTRRPTPTRPVEELVAERTSPAVKAALASLLNAPEPAGVARRGRRKPGVTA